MLFVPSPKWMVIDILPFIFQLFDLNISCSQWGVYSTASALYKTISVHGQRVPKLGQAVISNSLVFSLLAGEISNQSKFDFKTFDKLLS